VTRIFRTAQEWKDFRRNHISSKSTPENNPNNNPNNNLGFVPTMGALHLGHRSLIERSKLENSHTLVSIFVNPTQFNDPSDFSNYPKTWESDLQILNDAGVDFLLFPTSSELYPDSYRYRVQETEYSQRLCGKFRPGHFEGVLSVVMKLLNLADADRAYFGEKDYQQFQLIQGMVDAFFMKTQILLCPTVRESDGLALSSRNLRLTDEQRVLAKEFPRVLKTAHSPKEGVKILQNLGFKVDYFEEIQERRYGAVQLGSVRLIDNQKTGGINS
jgi:pantoate--beta-alanine ligase